MPKARAHREPCSNVGYLCLHRPLAPSVPVGLNLFEEVRSHLVGKKYLHYHPTVSFLRREKNPKFTLHLLLIVPIWPLQRRRPLDRFPGIPGHGGNGKWRAAGLVVPCEEEAVRGERGGVAAMERFGGCGGEAGCCGGVWGSCYADEVEVVGE